MRSELVISFRSPNYVPLSGLKTLTKQPINNIALMTAHWKVKRYFKRKFEQGKYFN